MLESAFAWIGQLAEWVGRFFPRREILDTTEGAIKYSGFVLPRWMRVACKGYDGDFQVSAHGPGIHWWWPYTSRWASHPTARQTDRLESQTMMTTDDVTFIVSGSITYVVRDLTAFVTKIHSPLTTVVDLAMSAVHDVCCDMDWAMLRAEQRHATKLKTKLRNAAQAQLGEYGIEVIKLQLNTLAKCRVLKVSQSISQEEN